MYYLICMLYVMCYHVVMSCYTLSYISACLMVHMVWLLYNDVLLSCYLVVEDSLLHQPGVAVQLHS